MPTIIDSLIVTLRLDPSNFTEGQRRAAENLRQLEAAAQRTGERVEQSGHGVVSFFRTLESPISGLRQKFETLALSTVRPQRNLADLASQGRRTGASIEAGATTGAAGLRVLGIAGLGAFAAITALDKAMSAASDSAKNVFGAAVGAAAAGVPIGQFTSISQALLNRGNVPEAETQGLLGQLRSAQVQASIGNFQQAFALNNEFAKMGVQANAFTSTPEETLFAIARRFHEVSADVASGYAASIGMSATLAQALHDLGDAGLRGAVDAERHRAMTDADSASARDLTGAQNELDTSWRNLSRRIWDDLDPGIAKFDRALSKVLDTLSGSWVIQKILGLGAGLVAPGGSIVGEAPGLWDKIKGALGFGGTPPSNAPSSGALTPSTPGVAAMAALLGGLAPDDIAIMQRESGGNPYIGTGSGGPGVDLTNAPLDSSGFPIWSGTVDSKTGLRSHAAGLWQIQPALWHEFAPGLGIHDFSPQSQWRVRQAILARYGNVPWAASGVVLPHNNANLSHLSSTGQPLRVTESDIHAQLALINQGRATGNSTIHNHGDININGDIHTRAANGEDLLRSLHEIAGRNRMPSQANTGLQ